MAEAEGAAILDITVVVSLRPRETREYTVRLPAPATVRDALLACADQGGDVIAPEADRPDDGGPPLGIWGRVVSVDTPLANQDRVEIYRPLKVDPKMARRQRFAHQGARSAGLFARRRPGSKPGY